MAFVRASKFRHVFGETPKAELTHTGVDASISGSCEGDGLAASPALFAYTLKNGRDVAVLPLGEWKRHVSPPYMMAHTGAVLDMAFSPFHDTTLATCSADSLIRIWGLGEEGVTAKIGPEDDECLCELHGHERKVVLVKWHPSAEYVIATAGQDGEVKVWDVEKGLEKLCVGGGDRLNRELLLCRRILGRYSALTTLSLYDKNTPIATSLDWNHDGSLIAIVKKKPGQGAQLSVFDPRLAGEGLAATLVHEGIRSAKCAWLGGGCVLVSSTKRAIRMSSHARD